MGVGIWNASFPLLFKASLKEIMHTLRAHILSDCSTGPTYIHKGTQRVKKGNTKPRPFWLNVYFIVIKMPACIIIVCVHWNIYFGREQETTQTRHRSSTLYCCFILCHQSPYWRVLNKVIKTFIPVSIFKLGVCYFLFWFEVILSLLFPGKSSRTPWIQGQVTYYAAVLDFKGFHATS